MKGCRQQMLWSEAAAGSHRRLRTSCSSVASTSGWWVPEAAEEHVLELWSHCYPQFRRAVHGCARCHA